jgi:hypothetical protein
MRLRLLPVTCCWSWLHAENVHRQMVLQCHQLTGSLTGTRYQLAAQCASAAGQCAVCLPSPHQQSRAQAAPNYQKTSSCCCSEVMTQQEMVGQERVMMRSAAAASALLSAVRLNAQAWTRLD